MKVKPNKKIVYFICFFLLVIVLSCLFLKSMKSENFEQKFDDHIDMLTYSIFDPWCCPSVYSNSRGCLCYDNDEDITITSRGGNRYLTKRDHKMLRVIPRPLKDKTRQTPYLNLLNTKSVCN